VGDPVHPTRAPDTKATTPHFSNTTGPLLMAVLLHFAALTRSMSAATQAESNFL
jgi:hypothetical protein